MASGYELFCSACARYFHWVAWHKQYTLPPDQRICRLCGSVGTVIVSGREQAR